ncbi:MAG TPA: sulfatase, partial [Labilithrix sp.]
MLRALFRLVLATAGAALAAILVAALEVRAVGADMAAGGEGDASAASLVLAELGVLLPMVLGVGGMIGVACIVLEPGEPRTPRDYVAAIRGGTMIDRLRAAAVAPLVVFATFFWTVGTAYAGRAALGEGKPPEAGLTVGVASIGLMVVMLASVTALLPTARRLVAGASDTVPQLRDPLLTGGVALAVVLLLFAVGIATGDTGGEGGLLGIFGVLKRDELDLRPVANAMLMALGAYGAQVALGRMRFSSTEKGEHH